MERKPMQQRPTPRTQQPVTRGSIFDDIAATATGVDKDPRPLQGDYILSVKELTYIPNGFNGQSFVFKFIVESATQIQGATPSDVHSTVALVWNLDKNKYGKGDVKKCIAAIMGGSPDEVTRDDIEQSISPEQPLTGYKVGCRVAPGDKINEKTRTPYINARFYAVEQSQG